VPVAVAAPGKSRRRAQQSCKRIDLPALQPGWRAVTKAPSSRHPNASTMRFAFASTVQSLVSMKLLAHRIGLFLLATMSGAAMAQTTDATNPKSASDQPPAAQPSTQGKCMPIGITASGDVVFPFECKEFLDQYKAEIDKSAPGGRAPHTPNSGAEVRVPGAASSQAGTSSSKEAPDGPNGATAAIRNSPAARKQKTAGTQPEPQRKIAESASKRKTDKGTPVCMHFRSYNAEAGTYRSFDGQTHSCPPE